MSGLVSRIVARFAAAEAGGSAAQPAGLEAYAFLFTLLGLFAAVFLPCCFGYGAGKGLIVFSAVGVGALIVISLLLQLTFLLAGCSSSILDPELWVRSAAKFSAEEKDRLAHWTLGIMSLLMTAALLLSAGLSIRLYEKRDL